MRRWGMVAVALAAWLVPAVAGAVSSGGVAVSPAFQEVQIRAEAAQAQYELQLTNRTAADLSFRLSVVDFGSLDEEGGVAFLGQPATELEHRYGLASWMGLEKDLVLVPAGKAVKVVVTIENRASLAPGGHYGAVLATAVGDDGQPLAQPRVGVRQVVSSLVLVDKAGGAERELKLVSQMGNGDGWRLPSQMEHRFQNAGNVHVVPRGVTEVRDPVGRVVVRGALNAESAAILPESFRRYRTPLTGVATAWWPGLYEVKTTYRYDGAAETKTLSTHVWYAGTVLVWLGLLVLAAAGGAGAWWWLHRRRRTKRLKR